MRPASLLGGSGGDPVPDDRRRQRIELGHHDIAARADGDRLVLVMEHLGSGRCRVRVE